MIRLENICWAAGEFSLANVNFEVSGGKYAVLMGRTGSGKTSIVEIICGLRQQDAGKIFIGDVDVSRLPPGKRGIGYVPQDGAMFPTMTVAEQIGFPMKIRGASSADIDSDVKRIAKELNVDHLMDRRPDGLSGGERQRVALGRALAAKPRVLLLDEPLSALDEDTRDEVAALLKRVQQERAVTALHITHSRAEAAHLSDELFRLEEGRVRKTANDES